MVYVLNIVLFLIYMYGLGYSLTRFEKQMSLEVNIMRIAIGMGFFPVLGVLLNFLKISLDWKIFLVLSLALPVFDILRFRKNCCQFPKNNILELKWHYVCLLLIIIFCGICYCYGPFTYPWLESDDSWFHAASIKYISVERNINIPSGIFPYMNPYPPGYDLLIAIMHQTSSSLYWTIKFFNGFIVTLGILFFYFFVKQFSKNRNKALLATFFLATIPCYLSHYIWSHSLVVTLFIPAFYLILKSKEDKRFSLPASVVIAGICLTQPTQPIKFLIMLFFLYLSFYLIDKRIKKYIILIPIIGMLFSLIWYGPVLKEYNSKKLRFAFASKITKIETPHEASSFARKLFSPSGGATTRAHKIYHYLFLPERNDRNNPAGVGIVISFFILLGILSSFHLIRKSEHKDRIYGLTMLFWLFFTFLGCNTKTFKLPVGLFAYRFWALFAIPASMLAAEATLECMASLSRNFKKLFLVAVVISVLWSSGYHKFITNTYIWSWGAFWSSAREIRGYLWMRYNFKPNTKVFAFVDNEFVIGHDMHSDYWSKKYQGSFKEAMGFELSRLSKELRENNFEYIIIGEREIRKYGRRVIYNKIESMRDSRFFEPVYEIKNSVWIFKVL